MLGVSRLSEELIPRRGDQNSKQRGGRLLMPPHGAHQVLVHTKRLGHCLGPGQGNPVQLPDATWRGIDSTTCFEDEKVHGRCRESKRQCVQTKADA
eukprot:16429507-Heterocapsa_arctica.AAC.1